LIDVFDATQVPALAADRAVHIFLPERGGEIAVIQAAHPGGTVDVVNGNYAAPLFTTYTVTR
jgi:hypothetical protein